MSRKDNLSRVKQIVEILDGVSLRDVIEILAHVNISIGAYALGLEMSEEETLVEVLDLEKKGKGSIATAMVKQAYVSLAWLNMDKKGKK